MADTPSRSGNSPTIPYLPDDSYCAWFRLVIKAQHAALFQSEANRRATWEAAKDKPPCCTRLDKGELDLQKFCTSEDPKFSGPPLMIKPFVKWVSGLQIFFTTKNVTKASEKINVIVGLINDSNLLKFYANKVSDYLPGSWEAFKTHMLQVALLLNWQMELQKPIHQLAMIPTESFMDYSTRARTLQTLANFNATDAMKIADNNLAQFLIFGLPQDLQDRVTEHQIMEKLPFESSYFRQRGQCHFCKKPCGNAAGACPGPIDKKYIPIPDLFITPPKPANYSPPRAWSNSTSAPGQPTNPPADSKGCYGHLDAAVIAGLEELHTQRGKNKDKKAKEDAKNWAENFANKIATS
ncbi:hypothetical protein MJO29_016162 [Puccinia striiformis f. sp. tritici]|nr:hypothetical protein MJO29_016162 [Puccinia striiformis f. sp. tritici]